VERKNIHVRALLHDIHGLRNHSLIWLMIELTARTKLVRSCIQIMTSYRSA